MHSVFCCAGCFHVCLFVSCTFAYLRCILAKLRPFFVVVEKVILSQKNLLDVTLVCEVGSESVAQSHRHSPNLGPKLFTVYIFRYGCPKSKTNHVAV